MRRCSAPRRGPADRPGSSTSAKKLSVHDCVCACVQLSAAILAQAMLAQAIAGTQHPSTASSSRTHPGPFCGKRHHNNLTVTRAHPQLCDGMARIQGCKGNEWEHRRLEVSMPPGAREAPQLLSRMPGALQGSRMGSTQVRQCRQLEAAAEEPMGARTAKDARDNQGGIHRCDGQANWQGQVDECNDIGYHQANSGCIGG